MKAYGIFIGVDEVNDFHYHDNSKGFKYTEKNAEAYQDAVESRIKLKESLLLTSRKASWENVLSHLSRLADLSLKEEGFLILTFTGHGDNAKIETEDGILEWQFLCMYDRMVFELEFRSILKRFTSKFKILMISDCCYLGGLFQDESKSTIRSRDVENKSLGELVITLSERRILSDVFRLHKKQYCQMIDFWVAEWRKLSRIYMASLCVLGSSQNQENANLGENSPYTKYTSVLLSILQSQNFKGNYENLHHIIKRTINRAYEPFYRIFDIKENNFFEGNQVFYLDKSSEQFDSYLENSASIRILENDHKECFKLLFQHRYLQYYFEFSYEADPRSINPPELKNHVKRLLNHAIEKVVVVTVRPTFKPVKVTKPITNVFNRPKVINPKVFSCLILVFDLEHDRVLGHTFVNGK